MDTDKVLEFVLDASFVDDKGVRKLTCASAHKLADQHGIKLKVIGQACDDNKVRITACQLGCFK
jgi:hypothetical protein